MFKGRSRRTVARQPVAESQRSTTTASQLIRRQRNFLAIACAAAVASTAGLVASALVRSPAQQAADERPPRPSILTAPAVRKVLTTTLTVRGKVVPSGSIAVTPGLTQGAGAVVVTATPKRVGDRVAAGDVIVQISGRPVIALPGVLPAYRDLRPGSSGPDVKQLQIALASLHYKISDAPGHFGAGTKQAVADLYEHLGYEPSTTAGAPGQDSDAAVQAARQSVTHAQRAVASSTRALASARGDAAISQARDELSYAEDDLSISEVNLDHIIATTGVQFPMAELVFVPSFPVLVGTLGAQVGTNLNGSSASVLQLDTGNLAIRAVLPEGQQQLVKPGMRVQIDDEINNLRAAGAVFSIGAYTAKNSGSDAAAGANGQPVDPVESGYPLLVKTTTSLAAAWRGQEVRLTVTQASSAGPVLVVPAAAVTPHADGTASVTVLDKDGTSRRVPVTVGSAANGEVAVTPRDPGTLKADDLVVTGR